MTKIYKFNECLENRRYVDEPHHLIFNESVKNVVEPIVKKLNEHLER